MPSPSSATTFSRSLRFRSAPLPLGVIRVLVGDLADERLVMVYRPAHAGDRPDAALLERVLDGPHAI